MDGGVDGCRSAFVHVLPDPAMSMPSTKRPVGEGRLGVFRVPLAFLRGQSHHSIHVAPNLIYTICVKSLCRFGASSTVRRREMNCRFYLHPGVGTARASSLRGRRRAEVHIERSHLVLLRPSLRSCGAHPTDHCNRPRWSIGSESSSERRRGCWFDAAGC